MSVNCGRFIDGLGTFSIIPLRVGFILSQTCRDNSYDLFLFRVMVNHSFATKDSYKADRTEIVYMRNKRDSRA